MGIKHVFVSGKSDSSDTSLVRPSNWNADHTIDGDVYPATDDGAALGDNVTPFRWSDLFLASGATIIWNSTETLTHSAGLLSLTAATLGLASVVSPSSISTDQDDYAPTGHGAAFAFRLTASAASSITGLSGGAAGRIVAIFNVGSETITLTDEDTNSTAANRFALTGNVAIAADAAVLLWYDSTSSRWRLIGGGGGSSVSLSDTAPSGASVGQIWIRTTDFAAFVYYEDSNSFQWVQFSGGGGAGGIVFDSGGFYDENNNEQLIFQTTASAVNYVEITNATTTNGPTIAAAGDDTNIDLNISPKGSGVLNLDFGSANSTLSDYEEGTFTPSMGGSGSDPTTVYGTRFGNYTKVGNLVYFSMRIAATTWSGGSGDLEIRDLPFTSATDTGNNQAVTVYSDGLTFSGYLIGGIRSNNTFAVLQEMTSGTGWDHVIVSEYAANEVIGLTGCYRVQ